MKKALFTSLLLCIGLIAFGQTPRIEQLNLTVKKSVAISTGSNAAANSTVYLQIGPVTDTGDKGLGLPCVNVPTYTPTIRGVIVYNKYDSAMYLYTSHFLPMRVLDVTDTATNGLLLTQYAGVPKALTLTSRTSVADTLTAAMRNTKVVCSNDSTINLVIPSGLPAGFTCRVEQGGAGKVTFVAGAGVTIQKASAYTNGRTTAQYQYADITYSGTNTYTITGALE